MVMPMLFLRGVHREMRLEIVAHFHQGGAPLGFRHLALQHSVTLRIEWEVAPADWEVAPADWEVAQVD